MATPFLEEIHTRSARAAPRWITPRRVACPLGCGPPRMGVYVTTCGRVSVQYPLVTNR